MKCIIFSIVTLLTILSVAFCENPQIFTRQSYAILNAKNQDVGNKLFLFYKENVYKSVYLYMLSGGQYLEIIQRDVKETLDLRLRDDTLNDDRIEELYRIRIGAGEVEYYYYLVRWEKEIMICDQKGRLIKNNDALYAIIQEKNEIRYLIEVWAQDGYVSPNITNIFIPLHNSGKNEENIEKYSFIAADIPCGSIEEKLGHSCQQWKNARHPTKGMLVTKVRFSAVGK